MNASELQPVVQFLQGLAPFDTLSEDVLVRCARAVTVGYYSKASGYVNFDPQTPKLYMVRSGAFEVCDPDGVLVDRVGEGEFFGFPTLFSGEKVVNKVAILEDGLVYHLPQALFNHLRSESRQFDTFFSRAFAKRLRHEARFKAKDLTTTSRISTLMSSTPIAIDAYASVTQAALLMRNRRVSSLLVTDNHKLVGILTDKDLRNRVLAAG
ncbi:MAG: CBS domain-containing protein, partial [Shewanella sp.]